MNKTASWSPEPDDEDFVLESEECFLTGVSEGAPDEFEVHGLTPVRHGVKEAMIMNGADADTEWGTPMHPTCFSIFKRLSLEWWGRVDIDGLRQLWFEKGDYSNRFQGFPQSPDCRLVDEQFYECVPGTEYLAANPCEVPGLDDLIQQCILADHKDSDVVFQITQNPIEGENALHDPFDPLSAELKLMILLQLSITDVRNLRLVSRSFQQLPQQNFHHLVQTEMPWVWEVHAWQTKRIDWHKLWCALSAADGGNGNDELERKWLNEAANPYSSTWDWLIDEMTEDERTRYNIRQQSCAGEAYPSMTQMEQILALLVEVRRKAGRQWPKATESKGLRNRRRIWCDIELILRWIAAL